MKAMVGTVGLEGPGYVPCSPGRALEGKTLGGMARL